VTTATAEFSTDTQRVLDVLKATPGEYVGDLYTKTNTMVHSRIADLRAAGHTIESKCFGRRDWRYRLLPA
jgi:biotin operon repressor